MNAPPNGSKNEVPTPRTTLKGLSCAGVRLLVFVYRILWCGSRVSRHVFRASCLGLGVRVSCFGYRETVTRRAKTLFNYQPQKVTSLKQLSTSKCYEPQKGEKTNLRGLATPRLPLHQTRRLPQRRQHLRAILEHWQPLPYFRERSPARDDGRGAGVGRVLGALGAGRALGVGGRGGGGGGGDVLRGVQGVLSRRVSSVINRSSIFTLKRSTLDFCLGGQRSEREWGFISRGKR